MPPIADDPPPVLVPVPKQPFRIGRLLPHLGFVTLFVVHESLGCVAAWLWYHDASITALCCGWYALWQTALLIWLAVLQKRRKGPRPSRGRLALFWGVQAAWTALGFWCFGYLFRNEPFAVEGVGGWLAAAWVFAALCDGTGRPEEGRPVGGYFEKVFGPKKTD
jgi:hypothetical protein